MGSKVLGGTMNDTPRTDIRHCEACGQVRFTSDHWQRQLAAAIKQRDKAIEFLQVYRNGTPLGHQPHMIAHEVDLLLEECGK